MRTSIPSPALAKTKEVGYIASNVRQTPFLRFGSSPPKNVLRMTWYGIIVFLLGFHFRSVDALPSFLSPERGNTLSEEIQCHGIPYGGIGFASHILTYYTLACLYAGSQPLFPWRRIRHTGWGSLLGVITFIASISLSVFTVIRCRNRWQFILIAVWKICLSATLALSTLTVAILSKLDSPWDEPRARDEITEGSTPWLILYVLGLIIGLVGLGSLVKETWDDHTIRVITYAFGGVTLGSAAIAGIVGLIASCGDDGDPSGLAALPLVCVLVVVVLGVLYSDWILGEIAGNLAGVPSGDIRILYWAYFVAKRLPMLTF
jgi:hypothetical protein